MKKVLALFLIFVVIGCCALALASCSLRSTPSSGSRPAGTTPSTTATDGEPAETEGSGNSEGQLPVEEDTETGFGNVNYFDQQP